MTPFREWWNAMKRGPRKPKPPRPPKPPPEIPPTPAPAPTVPIPPVASFTVTGEGLTRTLDASASTGDDLTYGWDVGKEPDGTATGKIVSVTYPHSGTREVILTVLDSALQADTASQTFEVTEPVVEPPPEPPPVVIPPVVVPPPPPPPPTGADVTITVDTSRKFQVIGGQGCSLRTLENPHLWGSMVWNDPPLNISAAQRAALMDDLYSSGMTRLRIHIEAAGLSPTNFAGEAGEYPLACVKEAIDRGVTDWWPSIGADRVQGATPETFAAYCLGVMRYWRDNGCEFPWFSILNEPSNFGISPDWYLATFALVTAQARAEGFTCRFVVPDDINPNLAASIARPILGDAALRPFVSALATHPYQIDISYMKEMTDLAVLHGLPLWMSEFHSHELRWTAFQYGEFMHRCFTEFGVSCHDYMWGFFGWPFDAAQLVGVLSNGPEYLGYTIRAEFSVVQAFAKVRPGSVRVGASSSNPVVLVSAYERDGKRVILALNTGSVSLSVGTPWGATATLQPQSVTALIEN